MAETSTRLRTITRLQRQQEALMQMVRIDRDQESKNIVCEIARVAAETLLVSRIGVWILNDDSTAMHAMCIYRFDQDEFAEGLELFASDFPLYFRALEEHKTIIADDARTDSRTFEFADVYLKPNDIYSMLDASVFVSGRSRGVVCCEQQSAIREWQNDEVLFVSAVADQVAQVFMDEERRIMEAKFRQVEKMQALGELAGGIAHDFNNQLTAIMGFADLIKAHATDEHIQRYVGNVIRTAANAAEITKQLLAFSRKSTVRNDQVDMHDLIRELHSMLVHTIGKHIHVHLALDAEAATVRGDASQLQNVLLNIGINARDAMPQGGHLVISTALISDEQQLAHVKNDLRAADVYLMIKVQDSGEGIKPEHRDQVFDPFFTTKGQHDGTGMGLSVSYGAVQQLGGTITLESELGRGTSFYIYLPLCEQVEKRADDPYASGEVKVLSNKATVMVVDDESDICDIIREAVTSMGHQARCFTDSQAALEYYRLNHDDIDLVFSDVNMPIMNGYKLFTAIKALQPDAQIIMSSGHTNVASADDFMRLGATDFLSKPYRMSTLINALQKHIA